MFNGHLKHKCLLNYSVRIDRHTDIVEIMSSCTCEPHAQPPCSWKNCTRFLLKRHLKYFQLHEVMTRYFNNYANNHN